MTVDKNVQQHLAKALEYIAKGDEARAKGEDFIAKSNEFYRHAAAEIELAREAGATWTECADALGHGETWCRKIVEFGKVPANDLRPGSGPFSEEFETANKAVNRVKSAARQALQDPAIATAIVNELPKETVYEIEQAVANRLGYPISEDKKLAGDPVAVVRAFDKLSPEQREMAVQDIVQHNEFADAVKQNPIIRDEVIINILGTPKEQKERTEENQRKQIAKNPIHGWAAVNDGLGEANRGLVHVLDALVKLAMHTEGGFDPDSDPLNVSQKRAEGIGRTIYEIEASWGRNYISDRIEQLREQYADQS